MLTEREANAAAVLLDAGDHRAKVRIAKSLRNRGYTLAAIGEVLDVSPQRIHQLLKDNHNAANC